MAEANIAKGLRLTFPDVHQAEALTSQQKTYYQHPIRDFGYDGSNKFGSSRHGHNTYGVVEIEAFVVDRHANSDEPEFHDDGEVVAALSTGLQQ